MNSDHKDALILLAKQYAVIEAQDAGLTSIDRLGFQLRLRTQDGMKGTRITFSWQVNDPGQAREDLSRWCGTHVKGSQGHAREGVLPMAVVVCRRNRRSACSWDLPRVCLSRDLDRSANFAACTSNSRFVLTTPVILQQHLECAVIGCVSKRIVGLYYVVHCEAMRRQFLWLQLGRLHHLQKYGNSVGVDQSSSE